jgi:hypothetical protein
MNLATSKSVNNITILLIVVFFLYVLVTSLINGGRWDLNEQIAFGQRLIEGVSAYANGRDDLFFPSSPYFPGVGYLSYFYNALGLTDIQANNQFMLFSAVSIGFAYFIMLYKLTLLIYPKISKGIVLTILTLFFTTHFPSYLSYMKEFKPDTILLLIGLIGLFIIENKDKNNILYFIYLGFLLFIATFFKQSFFIIYFLVYLLIFFHETMTINRKIGLIISYSLIGVFALFVIFDIENIYYFTVEALSKHPMASMEWIVYSIGYGTIRNSLFFLAILYFLYKRYKYFSFMKLESKYFIFALIWFLFSALSTAKEGGNVGNYEAGIVVLVPFAIFAINDIFQKWYKQKYFNYLVLSTLTVGVLAYSYGLVKNSFELIDKTNQDAISLEYITTNFSNKNALIDGNSYILAKKAGLQILTEVETVGHLNSVPNYDMSALKNAIKQQKYNVVFLGNYFSGFQDKEINEIFDKKYQLLDDSNIPTHLMGKVYIQRKEN